MLQGRERTAEHVALHKQLANSEVRLLAAHT